MTVLESASGALVSVHMDYVQHPQRRILQAFGDRRTLVLDLQTDTLTQFVGSREGHRVIPFEPAQDDRLRAEHQDVLLAMRRSRPPLVDGEAGLRALEIAESAIRKLGPCRP